MLLNGYGTRENTSEFKNTLRRDNICIYIYTATSRINKTSQYDPIYGDMILRSNVRVFSSL